MTEVPDFIQRAIEAQGKTTPEAVATALDSVDLDAPTKYEAHETRRVVEEAQQPPLDASLCPACEGTRQVWNDRAGRFLPCQECIPVRPADDPPRGGGPPRPITWEEFFSEEEAAITKRVRRGQQRLGPAARGWLARRVGGSVGDGERSDKEFVNTSVGRYRIGLSKDSDNTTEIAAHERMGVQTVHIEVLDEMYAFFAEHGLPPMQTYEELREHLRDVMHADA